MQSSTTDCTNFDEVERHERERQARKQIRGDFASWAHCAIASAGLHPAAHHLLLIHDLERLARGDIDRLMVLMPPGSAKSTYASILFPAWWFVQHPASAVIAASHTGDLALHFGRCVRDLIAEHGARLGYSLVPGNRAAGRWAISTKGQYFATGVRGPITGRRADLVIIDDPLKSQAEADSPAIRDHIWSWYRSDLTTRLKPRGRIVLIMTRWHEDDLGGRLLESQPGEWHTLRLPAIAEEGDPLGRVPGAPLWPEWEDGEALRRKRRAVGERAWSALFQQSPLPLGGSLFKVDRLVFEVLAQNFPGGRTVRAWDIAATSDAAGGDPDWTVGVKLHRTPANRYIVLDVVRLRGNVADVTAALLHTARLDGPQVSIGIPQDPGSAGKFMVRHFTVLLAGFRVLSSPEQGSKRLRAELVASQVDCGNLAVVRSGWTQDLVEELRDFPHGRKDDQVDALSRAFAMLTDAAEPARRLDIPLLAR